MHKIITLCCHLIPNWMLPMLPHNPYPTSTTTTTTNNNNNNNNNKNNFQAILCDKLKAVFECMQA